jgi:hypothetical protein
VQEARLAEEPPPRHGPETQQRTQAADRGRGKRKPPAPASGRCGSCLLAKAAMGSACSPIPEIETRSKNAQETDRQVYRFALVWPAASIGWDRGHRLNKPHCGSRATGCSGCDYSQFRQNPTSRSYFTAGEISVPDPELPETLQMSPSRRTLPSASSRSASG